MSVRRVLHVVPSLGGEDSDDCVAIRQLATALARLGIDNHVATARCSPKGAQPSGRPIVEEGVTYWHFQTHASFTTASLPMWSWLSSHIASFDVAHIHCLSPLAAAPAAVFARRHDVPYIVRPFDGPDDCVAKDRTSWWRRTRLDLLRSRVLRYAALMHFSSEAERQSVASLTAPVPSVVIPPAMPAAVAALPGGLRRRLGLAGSRQIVLATLPPDERGELAALIRAVAQMRAVVTDAVIVLVGDGPEGMDARLKAEMRAHGVGDY
jgi:glycosyltransferase involved in cell wall biosynthesis